MPQASLTSRLDGEQAAAVGIAGGVMWSVTAAAFLAGRPLVTHALKPPVPRPSMPEDVVTRYQRRNPWQFSRQPLAFAVIAVFAALIALSAVVTFGHGHAFRIAADVVVAGLIAIACGLAEMVFGTCGPRPGCTRYPDVRKQIEHEDDLINHRVSWLMASQAFLFAAYALGYTTQGDARSARLSRNPGVFQIIPIVALVAAFIIYLSVVAAVAALEHLRLSYEAQARNQTAFPLVASNGIVLRLGELTPLALPVLLMCAWTPLALHTS